MAYRRRRNVAVIMLQRFFCWNIDDESAEKLVGIGKYFSK